MESTTAPSETSGTSQPQSGQSGEQKKQKALKPSESSFRPWKDWEIRLFLEEWEDLEHRGGLRGKNNHELSIALSQRLRDKGLKKTCKRCFHMLMSLQDLYQAFWEKSEKPSSQACLCPFGGALRRILGDRREDSDLSGAHCDGDADLGPPMFLPPPVYRPPPAFFPPPDYQLLDGGLRVPFGALQWAPSPVMMVQHPMAPGWQPWHLSPPWAAPQLPPVFLPRDPGLQQPWAPAYDQPHLQ